MARKQAGPTWTDDIIAVNGRRCIRLFADAENEPCIPLLMS
jgi:hypothetical protein